MLARFAKLLLVREGEGAVVVYLGTLNLIVGLAMALGRSSGDALFLKRFGVEFLPQMFFLTSILLVFFSAIYASYADRISHARLLKLLLLVVAVAVTANWIAMHSSSAAWPYALYFLCYAVASEIVYIHFSLYASGILDVSQEKRVMPLIGASARLGAIGGGVALGVGASYWPLENMAIAWGLTLVLAGATVHVYHRGEPVFAARRRHRHPWADIREGLRFARRSAFLKAAGIGLFLLIVLISLQDYISNVIFTNHFDDENALAAFFGWFFAATNLVVLLLQLLATNRLLHRFGLRVVSLIFPLSTLLSFAVLLISPSFIAAMVARFNYNGMLHAFRNPAANLSYNALPSYIQGRARALSVGLVLPLGLAVAGGLLLVVQQLSLRALAALGCALGVAYLFLKIEKTRLYGVALIQLIQQQVFSRRSTALEEAGRIDAKVINSVMEELEQSNDPGAIERGANMFMQSAPDVAGPRILSSLPRLPYPARDRLLIALARHDVPGWVEFARLSLGQGDPHLRASALRLLDENGDDRARRELREWLAGETPRLKAAAAAAALVRHPELAEQARSTVLNMLANGDSSEPLAALPVAHLACTTADEPLLRSFLDHPRGDVRAAGLRAWASYCLRADIDCRVDLEHALSDSDASVREAAISAALRTGVHAWRLKVLAAVLDDASPRVRQVADAEAHAAMPDTIEGYAAILQRVRCDFATHRLICRCLAQTELAGRNELLTGEGFEQIRLANEKQMARNRLKSCPATDEIELIAIVLGEECQSHIESTIEILRLLGEGDSVHAIRAALASGDRRLRARGVDSLRYLKNDKLVRQLLPLLDAADGSAEPTRDLGDEIERTLTACMSIASPWLRRCIGQRLEAQSTR